MERSPNLTRLKSSYLRVDARKRVRSDLDQTCRSAKLGGFLDVFSGCNGSFMCRSWKIQGVSKSVSQTITLALSARSERTSVVLPRPSTPREVASDLN